MEIKVSRPQVKKLLQEHGKVELDLYEKGKDPNHYMTTMMQVRITDISELDNRVLESFKKAFGKKEFSIAIWKDDEE